MKNLSLYTVDNEYVNYLRCFDKNILAADKDTYVTERKYLGVVFSINGFNYFAPLSSPKESDYTYINGRKCVRKSIVPLFRILSSKGHLLGKVKLNNMIPVPDKCLRKYDVNGEPDKKYRSLVIDEIIYIRENEKRILKNAKILYKQKIGNYKGINYLNSTVNFKAAERRCNDYINQYI